MNSSPKHLLKYTPCHSLHTLLHSPNSVSLLPSTQKPIFLTLSVRNHGLCYAAHARIPRPVQVEPAETDTLESATYEILKKKLEGIGIDTTDCKIGEYNRLICPECAGGDSMERSFSLFITPDANLAMWHCYRGKCGWRGNVRAFEGGKTTYSKLDPNTSIKRTRIITEESIGLEPLCNELLAYFAERMISGETLRRNGVMQKTGHEEVAIAFTYRRNGTLVSCKYRDIQKRFWQEKDTERVLYGLDDIKGASDIIIVEGEMDKLSMEEAGFRNCVSVPDGAPAKVSTGDVPSEGKDTKYQFLWNCKEYLEKASRIILATDADPPGQALAEELARRLGRERCWRVKWPKKSKTEVCKDANEVLMYLGPHVLREVIDQAELYPISGLFKFSDFFVEIDDYYHHSNGYELGTSTGWKALDGLYRIVPGELTIVTGVPNSGKSEWIDALLCNINEREGWKFALCSMENKVREHARKLLEKHIRKPFFTAGYSGTTERMSEDDFERGKEWLDESFHLIRCEDDSLPSIMWVLNLAKAAVFRHGVRGLVIDPYNELDHQRPPNQTETEYVSQMLTKVKRFAQHHACHVWFVAHPKQLHQWVGGPPNLYDISGSAHFINKCDNGIVVHRNRNPEAGPMDQVQICVRKVRNKVAGSIGDALLSYNRVTGEFHDLDESDNNQTAKKKR